MLSQIEVRSTIRDCDGIDNWNFFPRKVPKPARVNTSKALCGSYPVNGSGASSYRSINTIRLPRPFAIYAFSPGKTWATIRVWSGAGSRASGFHQMGIETRQLVSFPLANRHESPFSETINPFSVFMLIADLQFDDHCVHDVVPMISAIFTATYAPVTCS